MALDLYLRPSPNQSPRYGRTILLCVIHSTATKTAEEALAWFSNPKSKVSAHYVIGRDGATYQCVSEDNCAYHAGISRWNGLEIVSPKSGNPSVNPISLGVELVNTGVSAYTEEQYEVLIELKKRWAEVYPQMEYVGHNEVAPGRKTDPGSLFIWRRIR